MFTLDKYQFIMMMTLALLLSLSVFAQQKKLIYRIINRNDSIGHMQVTQKISGDDMFFTLASVIETKVVMNIKVNIQEESNYHKEKLLLSSSKRFVNDKLKGSKETKADNNIYLLKDDNKTTKLNQKVISYNFAKLYFTEPVNMKEIYSDYYQKSLAISLQDAHTYKINLPEGGYNTYYYSGGICVKADLHSTLFNAQMILNQ